MSTLRKFELKKKLGDSLEILLEKERKSRLAHMAALTIFYKVQRMRWSSYASGKKYV